MIIIMIIIIISRSSSSSINININIDVNNHNRNYDDVLLLVVVVSLFVNRSRGKTSRETGCSGEKPCWIAWDCGVIYMRNLQGWLETRLAQITLT